MSFLRRASLASTVLTVLTVVTSSLPVVLRAQSTDAPRQPALLVSTSAASEHEAKARAADVAQTREVYVLAFRSGVRQGCRYGAADPLGAALASTRAVVQSVPAAEQAGVMAALDSAYAGYQKSGSCATLAGATRLVIVDEFHGAVWHASKGELFGDNGEVTDNGFTVVTRSVKIGPGFFHRIGAEADYTFTTQGGLLVAGRDRIAADDGNAVERWGAVERDVLARYPTLRVDRRQSGAPGSADVTNWRTVFTNPDTQAVEATLSATRGAEGKVWITADYPGLAGR